MLTYHHIDRVDATHFILMVNLGIYSDNALEKLFKLLFDCWAMTVYPHREI